jgi:hypothetical protein
MPDPEQERRFSDVLGALVAGVAHARSGADVEALRIACHYRQNDLLKGLPIPRLRIRRISVSLPLMLKDVVTGSAAEAADSDTIVRAAVNAVGKATAASRARLKDASGQESVKEKQRRDLVFYTELLDAVSTDSIMTAFSERLRVNLQAHFGQLEWSEGGMPPSDAAIRDAAGDAAEETIVNMMREESFLRIRKNVEESGKEFDADRARRGRDNIVKDEEVRRVINHIRVAVEGAAVRVPTVPSDLVVEVDTDSIKNAGGGPDVVTRLSMVLHEEGLEWLQETQEDGSQINRLLPE